MKTKEEQEQIKAKINAMPNLEVVNINSKMVTILCKKAILDPDSMIRLKGKIGLSTIYATYYPCMEENPKGILVEGQF